MEPTVFTDVDPKMRIAQEEIFGPVVAIIPCEDLEDAIEIANSIEYGLSSSLYTKDVNKAFAAMRDLEAGITYINAPTIGAEVHLPFGGIKATGNGHREGGIGAVDFYTEWKAVYVDYSDTLQKAQIDRGEYKNFHSAENAAETQRWRKVFLCASASRRLSFSLGPHANHANPRNRLRLPPRKRPLCHPRPGLHRRRGHASRDTKSCR